MINNQQCNKKNISNVKKEYMSKLSTILIKKNPNDTVAGYSGLINSINYLIYGAEIDSYHS